MVAGKDCLLEKFRKNETWKIFYAEVGSIRKNVWSSREFRKPCWSTLLRPDEGVRQQIDSLFPAHAHIVQTRIYGSLPPSYAYSSLQLWLAQIVASLNRSMNHAVSILCFL